MAVYVLNGNGSGLSRLDVHWTEEVHNVIGQLEVIQHLISRTHDDASMHLRPSDPLKELARLLELAAEHIEMAKALLESRKAASA